jgi:hypothetical protein
MIDLGIEKRAFILARWMILANFVMMMVLQKNHNPHLHSEYL